MSDAGGKAGRRPAWALRASLLVNAALVVKIVIFDPNLVIRPVCFDNHGPFLTGGLVALGGPQTERYRELLRSRLHPGYRVDSEGYAYASAWHTWQAGLELRWNGTAQMLGDGDCGFVREQAIELQG